MIASLLLPVTLSVRANHVTLRRARPDDVAALMRLLSDDPVSASRGDVAAEGDLAIYRNALAELAADPSNDMLVAVDAADAPVAMMQLTRIPGLARRGATRLQLEAVRVASHLRSAGIGSAIVRWAVDAAAPATGATLVQLTSDETRVDAHRFYERLGFVGSHRGFKYHLR